MRNRRTFLKKASVTLAGLILGFSSIFSRSKSRNMSIKSISNIQPLGFQWQTADPFLFCVHHEDHYPKGNKQMGVDKNNLIGRQLGNDFVVKDGFRMYHGQNVPGFPSHPHRGFETITVVRKGIVDHTDSMGASGRYGDGDVQWMTAGKGIQHAEMFPLIHQDKDNPLELFQIWLNLPKSNKFVEPYFKMLWADEIPVLTKIDENGKKTRIEIIAGSIDDKKAPLPPPDSWAANPENEVSILNINMEADTTWTLPGTITNINRKLFFYKGESLMVAKEDIPTYHSLEINTNNTIEIKTGNTDCSFLILQGKPIAEPVMQYGPFVMNTREEIQQAYEDYRQTQFGGWPWPTDAPVHPAEQGRFAKHADGKTEEKK